MECVTSAKRACGVQHQLGGAKKVGRLYRRQSKVSRDHSFKVRLSGLSLLRVDGASALLDAKRTGELGNAPGRSDQLALLAHVPGGGGQAVRFVQEEGHQHAGVDVDHESVPRRAAHFMHHGFPPGHGASHLGQLDGKCLAIPLRWSNGQSTINRELRLDRCTLACDATSS